MRRQIVGVLVACAAGAAACKMSEAGDGAVAKAVQAVPRLSGNVTFDPSGAWMAFSRGGDLWIALASGEGKPINVTGETPKAKAADAASGDAPAPAAVEIAKGPQSAWEHQPAWSPDGAMLAFHAARKDADDDPANDADLDIWVVRFPGIDWAAVAEKNVQLGGPAQVDEAGENGLFRDACPPVAAGETPQQAGERLRACVRHLIAPAVYVQLTSDPGAETDPVWVPDGRRIAFRSGKGGVWFVDLPPDLAAAPDRMAHGAGKGCGCRGGQGGGCRGHGGAGHGHGHGHGEGGACGCRGGQADQPAGTAGCPGRGGRGGGAGPCGCRGNRTPETRGETAPTAGQQTEAGAPAAPPAP